MQDPAGAAGEKREAERQREHREQRQQLRARAHDEHERAHDGDGGEDSGGGERRVVAQVRDLGRVPQLAGEQHRREHERRQHGGAARAPRDAQDGRREQRVGQQREPGERVAGHGVALAWA